MVTNDRGYDGDLRELRQRILLMAGRVEQMIEDSVKALIEQNHDLARQTISRDRDVNRDEIETDELCLTILSRRSPVGSDLRLITRALKMVTDIERIGDLAVNISERALLINGNMPVHSYEGIPEISRLVQAMIRDGIDAFVERDVERAKQVVIQDERVDQLYRAFFQELERQMVSGTVDITTGIHIHAVAKFLERMGDHGTNIAEEIIYMVKGKDVRHPGKGGAPSPSSSHGGAHVVL